MEIVKSNEVLFEELSAEVQDKIISEWADNIHQWYLIRVLEEFDWNDCCNLKIVDGEIYGEIYRPIIVSALDNVLSKIKGEDYGTLKVLKALLSDDDSSALVASNEVYINRDFMENEIYMSDYSDVLKEVHKDGVFLLEDLMSEMVDEIHKITRSRLPEEADIMAHDYAMCVIFNEEGQSVGIR